MGLLDLLQTQGSNLSNLNGTDGEVLQGSTDESKLHATKIGQLDTLLMEVSFLR